MNARIIVLFLIAAMYFGCSGRKVYGEENPKFTIVRFDTDLYQYITDNQPDSVLNKYAEILNVVGKEVIHTGTTDSVGFYSRLKTYFSEPTLMNIYRSEQEKFRNIDTLNIELSQGLSAFLLQFPQIKAPEIYLHVSGFNQSVIVTDEVLSLSADKYLGADFPLYQDFFYDYQRQLMTPDRMAPDFLLGFMMANLPFKGNEDILLDKILYEGKLRYILSRLLPNRQIWEFVAYNREQYLWCSDNQAQIWKTILENQHLFAPNYLTTTQYLKEAPHTAFLPDASPGRVGVWMGYQIIIAFMKQKPDMDLQGLMNFTDSRELLKQSKYKP
jgi:hypothetical protein